jgi:hypothetical protein
MNKLSILFLLLTIYSSSIKSYEVGPVCRRVITEIPPVDPVPAPIPAPTPTPAPVPAPVPAPAPITPSPQLLPKKCLNAIVALPNTATGTVYDTKLEFDTTIFQYLKVTEISMYSDTVIRGIQFVLTDGKNSFTTKLYGYTTGTKSSLTIDEGDALKDYTVYSANNQLVGVNFTTTKGISKLFGTQSSTFNKLSIPGNVAGAKGKMSDKDITQFGLWYGKLC